MTPAETRLEIDRAVRLLLDGQLVGLPTETVYGLAADAANPAAVARIFATKGRPADHPLIVHLSGDEYLDRWARDIPPLAWELAEQFWPGPLTLILKRRPEVSDLVTGGQDTIGIRVPGHPLALDLLRAFAAAGGSGGVAAPSANRFGRISPTTAQHVRDDLGDGVPLILNGGPCRVGIESTIVDLSGTRPAILRPGVIGADALAWVIGAPPELRAGVASPGTPRVSGSLEAHYAPLTSLRLVAAEALPDELRRCAESGLRAAVLSRHRPPDDACCRWLPAAFEAAAYGHDLYANLRELDRAGCGLILIEAVPTVDEWSGVADRLRRAAVGSGR